MHTRDYKQEDAIRSVLVASGFGRDGVGRDTSMAEGRDMIPAWQEDGAVQHTSIADGWDRMDTSRKGGGTGQGTSIVGEWDRAGHQHRGGPGRNRTPGRA